MLVISYRLTNDNHSGRISQYRERADETNCNQKLYITGIDEKQMYLLLILIELFFHNIHDAPSFNPSHFTQQCFIRQWGYPCLNGSHES